MSIEGLLSSTVLSPLVLLNLLFSFNPSAIVELDNRPIDIVIPQVLLR